MTKYGYLADIGARVYDVSDQTIPNNDETVIALDSERWDTDTIHDTVTNNTRLTCKTAGKYLISGMLAYEGHATGIRCVSVKLNGATYIGYNCVITCGAAAWTRLSIAFIYNLSVDDYVELFTYQNSGGNLDEKASANVSPEFMMQLIG